MGMMGEKLSNVPTIVARATAAQNALAFIGSRSRPVRQRWVSPKAYAADPASTGTDRSPVPTIPSVKMVKASGPATGFSASAAWAEVSMLVIPAACSAAAVVMMMARLQR
jgi:hypothetical protein